MAHSTQRPDIIGTIDNLLATLPGGGVKTAAPLSEPGGYTGPSTHPSAKVDDRLEVATEGARGRENEEDNKEDQPIGVDNTPIPDPMAKVQEGVEPQTGLRESETGGDPAIETASAKSDKDDPGSTHPARTDNDSLNGGKYAEDLKSLRDLLAQVKTAGDELCADMTVAADNGKTAAPLAAPATTAPAAGAPAVAPVAAPAAAPMAAPAGAPAQKIAEPAAAAQAGYELASLFAPGIDKQAVDRSLWETATHAILDAEDLATKAAAYIQGVHSKQADPQDGDPHGNPPHGAHDNGQDGPPPRGASAEGGGDGSDDQGQPPADGGGDPHGGGDPDELALLQLLSQGQGQDVGGQGALQGMIGDGAGGPGGMGGGAGGMPGMLPGGGDMGMGGPGLPPGGPGAGAPGDGGGQVDPAMLQQAMQDMGVDPSQVRQAAARRAAEKLASGGQKPVVWKPKTAADKKAFEAAKGYIAELISR